MVRDGVELFGQADQFEVRAGVLIKFCKPPNDQALHSTRLAVTTALLALQEHYINSVKKDHGHAEKNSVEQKRHNLTIRQIRNSCKEYRKYLGMRLAKNVWKG